MARRGRPRKALHSYMPTRERANHDTVVIERVEGESKDIRDRARVLTPCRIDEMYRRKQLTPNQYLTACDVKNLAYAAVGEPSVVSSYSDMVGQGSIEGGLALKEDAWEGYKSLEAVVGHTRWRVIHKVCVEDVAAGSRVRMKFLREGLDMLDGRVMI